MLHIAMWRALRRGNREAVATAGLPSSAKDDGGTDGEAGQTGRRCRYWRTVMVARNSPLLSAK